MNTFSDVVAVTAGTAVQGPATSRSLDHWSQQNTLINEKVQRKTNWVRVMIIEHIGPSCQFIIVIVPIPFHCNG